MKRTCPRSNALHDAPDAVLVAALAIFGALAGTQASAQTPYKVVGSDGKVTYTDRPPTTSNDRVSQMGAAPAAPTEVSLPLELRQAVARYPVTLYVTVDACEPCGQARQLLRQRGIPFAERQIQTQDDNLALERLSGGREVPTVAIGGRILRGLAADVWTQYLDAAGYPRDSQLPVNYQYPVATPLVARVAVVPPAAPARAPAPIATDTAPAVPNLPESGSGGIRF